MATAGSGDRSVDSRVVCSVCLEPYRGRQPKLLPCFHTFCLPCLKQLARPRPQDPSIAAGDASEDAGKANTETAATITCPTCRRVNTVPPGGVAEFQTNFYVEDDGQFTPSRPLPCDLCDEDHVSTTHCDKCETRSCRRCVRTHDKICKPAKSRSLKTVADGDGKNKDVSTSQKAGSSGRSDALLKKAAGQLGVVQSELTRLSEVEREMDRQHAALEHTINVRYAAGLGAMADARDECLVSLRESLRAARGKTQGEVTAARFQQARLARVTGPDEQAEPAHEDELQAALMTDTDLRRLERRLAGEGSGVLQHMAEENSVESVLGAFRRYMGRVVVTGGTEDKTEDVSAAPETKQLVSNTLTFPCRDCTFFQNETKMKFAELSDKLVSLITKYTQQEKLVSTLQNGNNLVCQNLASMQEKKSLLVADLTALRNEHVSLKNKCSLLCQDLATLQEENNKLQAEQSKAKTDADCVQNELADLQRRIDSMQRQQSEVTEIVSTLKDDGSKFHHKLSELQQTVTYDW